MIELIAKMCNELEENYNLIVMWNEVDEMEEKYIEIRIWNNNHDLLKHCFNTQLNTINMLRGIKFGIQATLCGDITYE